MGNAFFVIQYLMMLQEQELLEFNMGTLKWSWNMDEVNGCTVATANVVGLVKENMKRLPIAMFKMIPSIASIGSAFRFSVFELVVRNNSSQSTHTSSTTTVCETAPVSDSILRCVMKSLI
jgi:predicted ATPase